MQKGLVTCRFLFNGTSLCFTGALGLLKVGALASWAAGVLVSGAAGVWESAVAGALAPVFDAEVPAL